ncbi:RFC checkpoint protein Rad17 [Tilletia horrida]|uniref:RFC checkpoint protein Rad17 n=1 Tax=Tilletia horrida TaxID=155126 RepID=A0AAN6GCS8_9BASI|nr:RFC checkpoint protein Rad17 [Tilletia horrida]
MPAASSSSSSSSARKSTRSTAAAAAASSSSSSRSQSQSPTKPSTKKNASAKNARKSAGSAATGDTFSQPKLSFSSKPRADHDSYFLSPSPPRTATASASASQRSIGGSSARETQTQSQSRSRRSGRSSAASTEDAIVISSSDSEHDAALRSRLKPALPAPQPTAGAPSDELWVDRFPPESTATLAVHRAKIDQVRNWLTEALDGTPAIRLYRRILVLTGPSGAGKSATIRALAAASELQFDIVEWENVWGGNIGASLISGDAAQGSSDRSNAAFRARAVPTGQSATQLFADFLASSSRFGTLTMQDDDADAAAAPSRTHSSAAPSQHPSSSSASSLAPLTSSQRLMPPPPAPTSNMNPTASRTARAPTETAARDALRRIILLDDLPNLSHPPTRLAFQSTLATFLAHTQAQAKEYAAASQPRAAAAKPSSSQDKAAQANAPMLPPPIVLLLSDSTGREADASVANDALAGRSNSYAWRKDEELSLRTVLGEDLRRDPRVAEIKFNPVAPTILKKALTRILDLVHAESQNSTPAASQPKTTSRSRNASSSSAAASRKPKRDKAFEAELVRLLSSAADEGVPTGAGSSAANAKRTSIERPTGGDLRSAITQMQFVLEHNELALAKSSLAAGLGVGAGAGKKRDRSGAVLVEGKKGGQMTNGKGKGKQVDGEGDAVRRARHLVSVVSRRESNLPLFHAIGRVLYNKRVGDPGGSDDESSAKNPSSGTARGKAKKKSNELSDEDENENDDGDLRGTTNGSASGMAAKFLGGADEGDEGKLWTELPSHWAELERRPSKINVEAIWAQAPVDPSLIQLYLHHNFPTFCAEIEECSAGLEYISAADSDLRMWTESWTHASLSAYYAFLVSTGGILLSLPSPIPPVRAGPPGIIGVSAGGPMYGKTRHRQIRKSAFFDAFKRMREMGDALDDVSLWLLHSALVEDRRGGGNGGVDFGKRRLGLMGGLGGGRAATGVGVDATAELSSLSTVSRMAMAVEVVPLLAKMGTAAGGASQQPSSLKPGGAQNRSGTQNMFGKTSKMLPSASTTTRQHPYPPAVAQVGIFDHLTAAQAAQQAYSLRTEAIEDAGLLGGAEEDQDEEHGDANALNISSSALALALGDGGKAWMEQTARGMDEEEEEEEEDDDDGWKNVLGRSGSGGEGRLAGRNDVGERGVIDEEQEGQGASDPGLMDSEDEIGSDNGW